MDFLIPAFFSFLITALSVYPTIKIAKKFDLLDNPKKRPHPAQIHTKTIPRAGGLAIFIGIILSIFIFLPLEKHILGIILGTSILLVLGLYDDKSKNFSPYKRLLIQFLAAGFVVVSGVGISFITNPLGGVIRLDSFSFPVNFLGNHQFIVIADIFALFWMIWVMNMINWSKGVDGQMPGIVLVATLVLGILSLKLFLAGDPNQENIAKLSFITAGSALGFFIFNWHPAKIFPGFSGSGVFGLIIASLAILSGAKLATAGLVLLIPATDFMYTFVRRVLQGKSPVWGDRGHLHHLLLNRGLTPQQITCIYMALGVILGALALNLNSKGKLFASVLVALSVLGLILWLNSFGDYSRKHDPDNG
ncbi:hypothetical protein A3F00_03445 [Candidatus Daviesbacteria bacterium RIFCSPHIGHO2_12_FULL_37_11]|uniref:Undecaprenyl-phosphate alpha-N-acetylglucosaminyl 1-phosphate transferase n=1 Tax=Candidatus Daviesbacteria bacterium RIFCSPHIGHO2_12_FULL_37_11 TaxID=1797777 RepID=A0A1F5KCP0_9BACT|nr:MAG: hypothetical protein A2111_00795 [Candidatus Daviesbacteria bacterium GWA1_38_6]OGE18032.1 MAG: hypothetical protein A2769_01195 [Candidatus Daviesbacteria bacterium RIFCSPHIGHO2_01_FULL_37_27]OGE38696.1 MAG: hypothetical protein A3F00_03445 [Candidatus Daviesbacteria bacterium RIFCSPHIGHO2_12_FULL_37_11]OGE45786.1 MAG: hypothetical protein A3B39_00985 [Candidatus Daviesbacteria bacterium RIFCSPLOWO2_01_FULL_37_10]